MKTYIALLRGINVGGHKKILMAELRAILEKASFKNVQTYIQSGNIILQSTISDRIKIESIIKKAIHDTYGFEVPTIVKSHSEVKSILDNCPFSNEKKKDSHFMLLYHQPDKDLVEQTNTIRYPNEEFVIADDCVYFYCSTGYARTKFGNNFIERKLKVANTGRNYRTMVKILEMSD